MSASQNGPLHQDSFWTRIWNAGSWHERLSNFWNQSVGKLSPTYQWTVLGALGTGTAGLLAKYWYGQRVLGHRRQELAQYRSNLQRALRQDVSLQQEPLELIDQADNDADKASILKELRTQEIKQLVEAKIAERIQKPAEALQSVGRDKERQANNMPHQIQHLLEQHMSNIYEKMEAEKNIAVKERKYHGQLYEEDAWQEGGQTQLVVFEEKPFDTQKIRDLVAQKWYALGCMMVIADVSCHNGAMVKEVFHQYRDSAMKLVESLAASSSWNISEHGVAPKNLGPAESMILFTSDMKLADWVHEANPDTASIWKKYKLDDGGITQQLTDFIHNMPDAGVGVIDGTFEQPDMVTLVGSGRNKPFQRVLQQYRPFSSPFTGTEEARALDIVNAITQELANAQVKPGQGNNEWGVPYQEFAKAFRFDDQFQLIPKES